MTMPAQKPGTSRQDFGTPAAFIGAVERRFGHLEWDLAAHAENTKCGDRYFGPGSTHHVDAFRVSWAGYVPYGTLWLNPEFGNIEPWAEKCAAEAPMRHGLILMLTPASVGAGWFQRHVHGKAYVLALAPRLSFDGKAPFPKDCMLSVYGYGLTGFGTWRWDTVAE